jgi:hypothetical protein
MMGEGCNAVGLIGDFFECVFDGGVLAGSDITRLQVLDCRNLRDT